jgi:hypothetical protein
METNNSAMIALIEQQGVAALRVGFTLAVVAFLIAGAFIRAQATPIFRLRFER